MKACVIIPARFKSSRFPGKPLAKLLNKEMIIWVAELSETAVGKDNVYVATDDERISNKVNEYGFNYIMTSSNLLTGTDRVAEASKKLDYDIFVNVQGDEPLIDPKDILKSIELKKRFPSSVINSFCYLSKEEDPKNKNIPKLVINKNDDLIYISRAAIPCSKNDSLEKINYKKQVCIYSYSKIELDEFFSIKKKSSVENIEDIEILRFFELGKKIKMFEASKSTLAVDIFSDIEKVEKELKNVIN
tara:strand:+ start:178 stop:915 length:738 start_codon:yes stop_codon:yes gene_type:complete